MSTYEQLAAEMAALEKKKSDALKSEVMAKVEATIAAAEAAQQTIDNVVATTKKTIAAEVTETKRVLEASKTDIAKTVAPQIQQLEKKIAAQEKRINELLTKLKAVSEKFGEI